MAGASASADEARPWRAASRRFRAFLRGAPAGLAAIVADASPDSLTAASLLRRAIARAGRPTRVVFADKGEDAGGRFVRADLAALRPAAVIVAGLGGVERLRVGCPALALARWPVDDGPGLTALSSAGWEPPASVSVLAYWLAQGLVDVRRLDWVAAVGAMAAFGERVATPLVIGAKSAHGGAWLHETTRLLTAAARSAAPEPETALRLLAQARDPRDLALGDRLERDRLRQQQAEAEAEIERVKQVAPLRREPVTLVMVPSGCAVHGLLAYIWAGRARPRPALAVNAGYLPGQVAFALAETEETGWHERLTAALPPAAILNPAPEAGVSLAGRLPAAAWPATLERLGLAPPAWAPRPRPRPRAGRR
jgi:hypothetical protein